MGIHAQERGSWMTFAFFPACDQAPEEAVQPVNHRNEGRVLFEALTLGTRRRFEV